MLRLRRVDFRLILANLERVEVQPGNVVAVVVIGDNDVDRLSDIRGQIYDLGQKMIGDEHAVAFVVHDFCDCLVIALLKELDIALFGVLAAAHLECDEAVSAEFERVGGQRAAHCRVAADRACKEVRAVLFDRRAVHLLHIGNAAEIERSVFARPADPGAGGHVFKIAVYNVVRNNSFRLIAAAGITGARNHAENHKDNNEHSKHTVQI